MSSPLIKSNIIDLILSYALALSLSIYFHSLTLLIACSQDFMTLYHAQIAPPSYAETSINSIRWGASVAVLCQIAYKIYP